MKSRRFIPFFLLGGLLPATAASDREALKFFETEVRPLLAESCFDCHSAEKQKGGLRLDHVSWMLKGGDSGAAIVPGNPDESLLVEAVRREDPDFEMPPKTALTSQQIGVLEKWVADGAFWPADPNAEVAEKTDQHGFTEEDREWWAIQPVQDPEVPANGEDWARNEIDRFVARKLDETGLKPAPDADRLELVRRVYFDLHGLPPTPEQVSAFMEDQRPDAYSRLIDELLASPRYGERWAQHWLDVVRFAESDGYRADDFRPGTWKYRDYVIRSFNEDKPYDEFVREQLAADEIAPNDPDRLIATAFLRLGIYEWNQRNAKMQWDIIMTEMTNVTAEAFLGIGIGCAQCHDHKFDPILQKDHFALQAFLNTTWWPENHPLAEEEEKAKFDRQYAEWSEATADIRAEITAMQQAKLDSDRNYTVKQFPEDVQKIYNTPTEERSAYEEQLAQLVQRQVDQKQRRISWDKEFEKKKDGRLERYKDLKAELAKFDHLKPDDFPKAFIATDIKNQPASTYLAKRTGKEEVEPAFLTLLGQPAPKIEPTATTTGRRKALAEWVASPNNPLSTRVIVNRIWQRHFGSGIVPTPNDFGTLGEEPSYPELLDWLTSRFLDGGWRFKDLHRTIMMSAVYQQTARLEPSNEQRVKDPTNRLLWRFPPRRLDAEQVRDAMLAVSGELKHREGGSSKDGNSPVRSIYVKKLRNSPDKVLNGFDAPMGFDSAPSRTQTTTPTQSLLLVNGSWTMKRAEAFAKRILNGAKTASGEHVRTAFRAVYGREPNAEETQLALSFLNAQLGEVSTAPVAPPSKYPGETGQRPTSQVFDGVADIELGSKSLWIQPGSKFERLQLDGAQLQGDSFTVEAVANLDRIYKDASVNTLVSRWNGSHQTPGWSLGVTSERSKYQPRNLIIQLVGKNVAGGMEYEVVASGLRFPLNKPVYVAAVVTAEDLGNVGGHVTFYMKDLSDPNAKMQVSEVPHSIAQTIQTASTPVLVGGRNTNGHQWDGQVARLAFASKLLTPNQFPFKSPTADRFADFDFSTADGEKPAPGANWQRSQSKPASTRGVPPKLLGAVTDFCHALFNSNEFLYLH